MEEAARKSGVGQATISRLEQSEGIPTSRMATLLALKRAFEEMGVEFVGEPYASPGLVLHKRK
jgi:hypothetical protein